MTSPAEPRNEVQESESLTHEINNQVEDITQLIDSAAEDCPANQDVVFCDDDNKLADAGNDLDGRLIQARLGIASGLFDSIAMKHLPTARHCLRVALGCSAWFDKLSPEFERDELEIAALLHDLGKIGVPDEILTKPGHLNVDERTIVEEQRKRGLDVLKSVCGLPSIVDCVTYSSTWFDGTRNGLNKKENELPLSSRMLAIVDAFDSMTTDQVYRKALSLDRAVAELFENAGTQFDPELVNSFAENIAQDWFDLQDSTSKKWSEIARSDSESSSLWTIAQNHKQGSNPHSRKPTQFSLFQATLFSQMLDAVAFVDRQGKILFWNPAAERITGLTSASVLDRRISPSLMELQDESGTTEIPDNECPIQRAMERGESQFSRYSIRGRSNSRHVVELQVAPVIGQSGDALGASIVIHDSSNTSTLEERVETLYSRVAQDPLTRVANRAEFDRIHAEFVEQHLQEKTPCSLIICDLDFFKTINDEYGHQAGDDALIAFASLLKRFHRVGDLVARYGGEEFVLLCAGCDNKTATERAEEIRHVLQNTPLESLNNKCLTASFGVTEVQQGDSPELMLRRADRALQMAKENGRNRVVQLGAGMDENFEPDVKKSGGFLDWFRKKTVVTPEQPVQHATLISQVPLELAVQKLRGFVSDQDAQIVEVEGQDISIKVSGSNPDFSKRSSDRPVPFHVLLQFSSVEDDNVKKKSTKTRINVVVTPIRARDRRINDLKERANLIINSIKSYLMASCEDEVKNKAGLVERAATESNR